MARPTIAKPSDATNPNRVAPPSTAPPRPHKANYSRWRAGTLSLVYVLIAIHITHWKITGKTLAPLELNEVMYTLELGIVTAGFLFMAVAALSAAIFGRFFCSWGCHILALEDLCAWLLKKVGIHPKPVRSRVLLLVPPGAMFYMFIWPQVSRLIAGKALPPLHVLSDNEGWASYLTTNFWRNLPGPWITVITFALCGFAIVYFLGSRGFCIYGCPYGAAFSILDRLAPGRIKLKGDCAQCATCTATCQTHIRVHEELAAFGRVVNPACMKDLDCVAACPHGVLGYGFARPAILEPRKASRRPRVPYDFSFGEDCLMAVVFLVALLIFRGLYGTVPFLMTLAIGGILAYATILSVRLVQRDRLRLNNFQLKRHGRLTGRGMGFAVLAAGLVLFVAHSALIRYHEYRGQRAFEEYQQQSASASSTAATTTAAAEAIGHLRFCERWGLFEHTQTDRRLAVLLQAGNSPADAEPYLRRILAQSPADIEARLGLGRLLTRLGRTQEAVAMLNAVTSAGPPAQVRSAQFAHLQADADELLGEIYLERGDLAGAKTAYKAALALSPASAGALLSLGELLAEEGHLASAAEHFRAAIASRPDLAAAHYNLGVMLAAQGQTDEAIQQYRRALTLEPADPQTHNNLGFLLAARGDLQEAAEHFRQAIKSDPALSHAHFNLARILQSQGQIDQAAAHFNAAARLDPQYAKLLGLTPKPQAASPLMDETEP